MNFLEKLDSLMSEMSINKAELSRISGVPYTTIDGFYKKGYENAKISTIRKIARALGTSLDYLAWDDDRAPKHAKSISPPDPLTVEMERLVQTLTLEQATSLCAIASYILEAVEAREKQKRPE